jgi:hypothetical protein
MTFSEFIDFLLLRLYQLEREHGTGRYFFLNWIAQNLKEEIPLPWIRDAAKVLESRRLAHCIYMVGGLVQAELSGEGRLWVEENKGAVPKLREIQNRITVSVSGSNNEIAVAGGDQAQLPQHLTIEAQREPAFTLLNEIEAELKRDAALSDADRSDSLADLEAVRTQLKKRAPNRPALAAILEPLSQISSIATRVAELIDLINP